jgi:HEAT repeat protein
MSIQDCISSLLTSPDSAVRRRSAEELMKMNSIADDAIAAFAQGLTDSDKGVRDICAMALTRVTDNTSIVKSSEHIAPLIAHEDIEIRNLAGDILLKFGAPAVSALYPYLLDEKADNRKFACDIIGLSNNQSAIPLVRKLLSDADDNVRCAAVEALGFLKASDMLGDIVAMYDDEIVRPYVVAAVGNLGGKQAQEFLLKLIDDETDEFTQIAAIDALAVCADDVGIAHKLLALLPTAHTDIQPVLLRTIYGIAYRLQVAIELPSHLRRAAYQALSDEDPDTRIAGLLALGKRFEEEDVPALLQEIARNNAETQQHIFAVIILQSAPSVAREFFNRLFPTLLESGAQIPEVLGYLATTLSAASYNENAAITVQCVIREYPRLIQEHRKEIVAFLLSVHRESAINLLNDEISSGIRERVEDATYLADLYSLHEVQLPT